MSIRPAPKAATMNKAAAMVPHAGVKKGDNANAAGVGNETKAAVGAAQSKGTNKGIPTGGNAQGPGNTHLSGAVGELHAQHPHPYHDHGPHHGTTDHIRHKPVQVGKH